MSQIGNHFLKCAKYPELPSDIRTKRCEGVEAHSFQCRSCWFVVPRMYCNSCCLTSRENLSNRDGQTDSAPVDKYSLTLT